MAKIGRLATEDSRSEKLLLARTKPIENRTATDDVAETAFDDDLSDPNRPVPFIEKVAMGMPVDFMTADQRFASRRPDVLVYESATLDKDLTIAGPIKVDLIVSTTGTDSDWVIKIIDVYPNTTTDPDPNPTGVRMAGYQQLVRGDVMRGKFRNSLEKPEPFIPSEPTRINFEMPDILHTFQAGHRMMIQVQSNWFPLIDRNPQQFTDIDTAKNSASQKATQKIFRTRSMPSRIDFLVMP